MPTLLVDCTPMLIGGANGGAKGMILRLLRDLPPLLPQVSFIVLVTPEIAREQAALLAPNLRFEILAPLEPNAPGLISRLRSRLHTLLAGRLPPGWLDFLRRLSNRLSGRHPRAALRADALFCPFTAPTFHQPGLPTLSILYDFLFQEYPHFFSPQELFYRQQNFQAAARLCAHFTAISEFTRQEALRYSSLRPEQISVIPISAAQPLQEVAPDPGILNALNLQPGAFLLYPANGWPHKNHALLLRGLEIFLQARPASPLRLVLPGDFGAHRQRIEALLQDSALLRERVLLPGYLTPAQLSALYTNALALVFPSLYEGFGIPVLEAFRANLPVLCSRAASLPEVAGEAALYFDPQDPQDLARALTQVEENPALRASLTARGRARLQALPKPEDFVQSYCQQILRLFPV